MSLALAVPSAVQKQPQQSQTFDFTKRKRWTDLLINDLADAIIFILSPACKILYCGASLTELLGWAPEEIVDGNLMDILNQGEQAQFRMEFDESHHTRQELLTYIHFKCKDQFLPGSSTDYNRRLTEVFCELMGYPHFVHGEASARCFFAVAKPYPSRNTTMLNSFLELKMENERLQQRLNDLRTRASNLASSPSTSMAPPQMIPGSRTSDVTTPYYSTLRGAYDDMVNTRRSTFDGPGNLIPYASAAVSTGISEHQDDGSKKKKMKKSHPMDQYVCVTCGRTDSPEWRKGPHGPKTLCNACGLRWAKQMRKTDDGDKSTGDALQGQSSSSVIG